MDISIHAPRVGGDPTAPSGGCWRRYFNPRPPRGGRPDRAIAEAAEYKNFNPRPPRGGRHASECFSQGVHRFQSTPPAWGATPRYAHRLPASDISIHAPRVGGDRLRACGTPGSQISIHAPRVGGDHATRSIIRFAFDFNPRPPRGGRLSASLTDGGKKLISIHAPRVGGDRKGAQKIWASLVKLSILLRFPTKMAFLLGSVRGQRLLFFPKRGANLPRFSGGLGFAVRGSAGPLAGRWSCSRSARSSFHIGFPDSRSAGCPFPGP